MRLKIISFIFLFLFLFQKSIFAELSLKAEVDRTTLTIDEVLTYKLQITSQERNIPSAHLPKFSDFLVLSRNQSSNIAVNKGKIETRIVYVLILAPLKTGKFKIEPAFIKIKNNTYYTDSFEIEVKESLQTPIPLEPESPSDLPQNSPSETESMRITL